jgi:hypothetical protein
MNSTQETTTAPQRRVHPATQANIDAPRFRVADVVLVAQDSLAGAAAGCTCVVTQVSQQYSMNGYRRVTVIPLGNQARSDSGVHVANELLTLLFRSPFGAIGEATLGAMTDLEVATDAQIVVERERVESDPENEPDICPEHGAHNDEYCPGCLERKFLLNVYSLADTVCHGDLLTEARECEQSVEDAQELAESVMGELERKYPQISKGTL